jgi:hypothetical protein
MLAFELLNDKGVLIIMPDGPLAHEDFEHLGAAVDQYVVEQGSLNGVMIYVESFPGWDDFEALISHVRFVRDNSVLIDKVAAVTDSKFLTIMPKIVDRFISAEVRHFDYGARDEALAWLSGQSEQARDV